MAGEVDHNNGDVVIGKKTRSFLSLGVGSRYFPLRVGRMEISASAAAALGMGFFCLLLWVMVIYPSPSSTPPPAGPFSPATSPNPEDDTKMQQHDISEDPELIKVVQNAKMTTTAVGKGSLPPSEMVIITTINKAWAEPGSILDLFLESFWSGDGTQELVRHLVIVSLDQKAHQYCQAVHPHCYALTTPGVSFTGTPATFKSDEFMRMVWRRMEFYTSVLKLGIDFVFTDVDIVWFRNPFPHFHEDADFQIACDIYTGDDSELHYNSMNGGFGFVRSNDRARRFFQHWYDSRERFPGMHEQDVLNKIKDEPFIDEIGLRVKVLDTDHFGGICQPIKDLNVGCTMHATCCIGMESKIRALTAILQDWKHFSSSPPESRNSTSFAWKPERTGCWI